MRRVSLFLLMIVLLGSACSDSPENVSDDATALVTALHDAAPADVDRILTAFLGPALDDVTTRMEAVIQDPAMSAADKHRLIQPMLADAAPTLREQALIALRAVKQADLGPAADEAAQLLHLALTLAEGATKAGERPPYWSYYSGQTPYPPEDPFAPELPESVADKFWLFYHWTEIIGALYDDTDYAWVFADSERTSFISQEAGASGIEQFHDWWQVPKTVWDSETLSDNEKLMATKYTMWQNEDWGGGNHYINEWWSWEAAYKEEDCALFTGNQMAALAALYEMTRDPRTLNRLQAMLAAFWHYDRFTVDDPNPLAQEEPDGRITRGTKTRNLYLEDEMNIFTIEFVGGELVFHHNNSWPDHYTGRERKNVSRDQYYGLFLGYRTLWEVLTAIDDRTTTEQELLDDLVEHTQLITDYVFGQSNLHWDWGIEYMLYALFEGSCANPPNFTFMMFFGHVGLEEMTGESFTQFDTLHDLGHKLFSFGRSLGKVWLSAKLFEPAHTGLTALNQYLSGFYMSDITVADWLFLWPPELIDDMSAGRRRLWRRVIAACYRKFGIFAAPQYRDIAAELFDEALNPRPTIQRMFNSYQGDYAKIEPQGVGLEDFMLPLTMLAGSAQNSAQLATALATRYDELVADGSINFDDTDLPYETP